jgi:hypothetical protein
MIKTGTTEEKAKKKYLYNINIYIKMVNLNFLLKEGVNNELQVTGNGLKTYDVNPFGLSVGTRGCFKVLSAPTQIQPEYMSSTFTINKNSDLFKLYMNTSPTLNVDQSGNKLIDVPSLYVNHGLDVIPGNANVSNVTVSSGLVSRTVDYRKNTDINEDVAEIPNPELNQIGSYLLKAIPSYDTVYKNVSVKKGLIPTIGPDYDYVRRTTVYYVLVEQKTSLTPNAGYIATGSLSHYIPYYTTIENIENSMNEELSTNRYCQRIVNCVHKSEEYYVALNKSVTFTIDPRFNNPLLNLTQTVTVSCDIQYTKYDDFDNNKYAGLVIKKIHQSFGSNAVDKYVVNYDSTTGKHNLMSTNILSLKQHENTSNMTINDMVLNLFTNQTGIAISASGINYVPNLIHMQKDIMVFSNANNTLYSLKPFPDYVITPETNVNFAAQPMYNKNGVFYTVYVYKLVKQITLPLGVELLGSNICGSLLKSKVGNQQKYFEYVVKPNNRLVFWDMNHPAEEQIYVSMTTLFLEKDGANYLLSNVNSSNYNLVKTSNASTVPDTWNATLKTNKNISLKLTKNTVSEPYYKVDMSSIKFNMDCLRNVLRFNIVNSLPVDIELTGDKTIFDEINPQTGTYAVLADNNDVAAKDSLTVCIRQAFNPNLWDIKSFSDDTLPSYDV